MSWGQVSAGAAEVSLGVISHIIADLLVIMLIAAVGYVSRSKIRDLVANFRFSRRMRKNGIINFYNSRQEYVTSRTERSLGDYILRCRRQFTYVGFYLSGATERDRIDSVLSTLLDRGCRIELVLLDPNAPPETIRAVERYLAVPDGTLQQLLRHACEHFHTLRSKLSIDAQSRFAIKLHQETLSSSAMLLDEGESDGRMLVDNKIHQAGRDRSFGIEFLLNRDARGLAEDFATSFKRIAAATIMSEERP